MNNTTQIAEKPETETSAAAVNPREAREKAGLDPEQMAALIGMSAFGYRSWEAGTRRPGGPAQRLVALIGADPKGIAERLATL